MARKRGRRAKALAATIQRQKDDIQSVMNTAEGRRFVYWVIDEICNYNRSVVGFTFRDGMLTDDSAVPRRVDEFRTHIEEGKRQAGLRLLATVRDLTIERTVQMFGECLEMQAQLDREVALEQDSGSDDRGTDDDDDDEAGGVDDD